LTAYHAAGSNIFALGEQASTLHLWNHGSRNRLTTEDAEDTEGRDEMIEEEALTGNIIEGAMAVHSAPGPGLFESAYEIYR
jgi:hypothetical protein